MTSIYVTDDTGAQYDKQIDISGSYTFYVPPGASGLWHWVADRYPYLRQSGNFTPDTGGAVAVSPVWSNDSGITQLTRSTVQAYTAFENLDKLYDYSVYQRTQHPEYNLVSSVAGTAHYSCNLLLSSTATDLYSYDPVTDTLKIKVTTTAQGANNKILSSDKTIAFEGAAKLTSLYQDQNGLSSRFIFNNLSNTSLYIIDNNGNKHMYQSGLDGTFYVYLDPLQSGDWKWILERYPYKRQSGIINIDTGGDFNINPAWVIDGSLTEQVASAVALYTDLGTAPKVNDYEAYWRTTEDGIIYDDTLSRNGETIDWTPYDVGINPLASTPYSLQNNKVTVKTTNLVANTITTTGTFTYENGGKVTGVVTDITGVASQTTISGLTGCTVAIITDTGTFFDVQTNVTGVYTVSVPSDKTGTWRGVITKYKRKYQEFSFVLGAPLATNVTYLELPDDRVVAAASATPQGYTQVSSTQEMYDYFSWWSTTVQGIAWYKAVSWQGLVLDAGRANIQFNPNAASIASMDPVTKLVTIKSTSLSGDLTTTGTVTRINNAKTTGIVIDSTGTTAIVKFTGFENTNQLYVEDAAGVERLFTQVAATDYVLYLLPSEQTDHPWKWAAKKKGHRHATGVLNVEGGGSIPVQVGMGVIYRGDGSAMYTNDLLAAGVSADWTTSSNGTPRIKLGDRAYTVQEVYNAVENSLVTKDALKWLANGHGVISIEILPAGNFIFLTQGWRFMQSQVGNNSATVNGFGQSSEGVTVDDINGPVSLLSASGALSEADLNKLRQAHAWLEDIRGTGFAKDTHSLTNIQSLASSVEGLVS